LLVYGIFLPILFLMNTLNIAILGPGGIADDQHAPAVTAHPETRLWSVLSRSRQRAEGFASRHNLASPHPAYTDLGALLRDPDLHAVIIATPDRLHSSQVIECARAGKHVLLEKPMASSLEECDAMIQACRENGVVLALAYHLRWHAGHRAIQNRVKNGELGKLRHCRVHWTFAAKDGSNWRSAPETGRWWSLAANGTHCLDLIRWMLCPTEGEVTEVTSLISRAKFNSPHDETAIVALQFESGATAEFCVSVQFESDSRIEIYGDEGAFRLEATMGRHGRGQIFHNAQPFVFEPENPFFGELNNFVDAIHTGHLPEVPAVEGRRNVEILLEAIRASGRDHYA
jgi:predicted dehydrogenase